MWYLLFSPRYIYGITIAAVSVGIFSSVFLFSIPIKKCGLVRGKKDRCPEQCASQLGVEKGKLDPSNEATPKECRVARNYARSSCRKYDVAIKNNNNFASSVRHHE